MSLTALLDNLLLQPLLLIYGAVLDWCLAATPGPGWAIILFSILLNLALLPIYYQMEQAGRANLRLRTRMNAELARMKAHYTGRELYYYVRAVHRQYGYRPTSVLYTSGDLYLQIAIFATVYRFISAQSALRGAPFFAIPDLGRPDGLLFGANLLPLVMTLLNIASALLYSAERAQRRNAFLLSAVFLVLLYPSPAGLVLYWTSNNAWSLLRNLAERELLRLLPPRVTRTFARLANQE